jgi:hypothetical protein
VDAVKSLTHWRRGREVKTEHTREVVRALVAMGERIERLERAIAALAIEASRDS